MPRHWSNFITALGVALAMAAAIAMPGAASADAQLDKMRVKVAAFIADKMEKLGGSRIVYRVDADGFCQFLQTGRRAVIFA